MTETPIPTETATPEPATETPTAEPATDVPTEEPATETPTEEPATEEPAAPVEQTLELSPNRGASGTRVTITGAGFAPGETVDLYFESTKSNDPFANATAGDDGVFTLQLVIPDHEAGFLLIAAVGESSGETASRSFRVTRGDRSSEPEESATEEPAAPAEETEEPQSKPTEEVVPTEAPTEESVPTEEVAPTEEIVPTDVPTEEPAPTETPVPTEEPTAVPEPVQRELVLYPVADTSVSAAEPDAPQNPDASGGLATGGENGSLAYVTFQVDGIAAGTVLNASLVLTDVGETSASGGRIWVVGDYWIEEGSLTYSGAPTEGLNSALTIDGAPAQAPWIDPWVETWIDVTGTVSADGLVTFVIGGVSDTEIVYGSRESGSPPRLVITVEDPAQ
jgi:hypothetical protein